MKVKEENFIKVLFIGDIVASKGRKALKEMLPYFKNKYNPHFIIVNGENAAGGKGITQKIANEFFDWGIHGVTLGNHTWANKDVFDFIDLESRMVRPANYPIGTPGRGMTVLKNGDKELVLMNIMGRTFMSPLDCPFMVMDQMLHELERKNKCIFVDFHAEATSEKVAMGWYLDGRVSAMVGTHTHVQTNDHIVLPQGTAYITDVGMVGSRDGVLGVDKNSVLQKFITQLPARFTPSEGKWFFHAVLVDIDEKTGSTNNIQLIRRDEDQIMFE